MARKVTVTDYKTKRINALTGGRIQLWEIPDYPTPNEGKLPNSFTTRDGKVYLGDYARGWWYHKHNLLVCPEKPHGVAIRLNCPTKDYPHMVAYLNTGEVHPDFILGYHGFSHRGGQTFKIGDRFFDAEYQPIKEDYPAEVWDAWEKEFTQKREAGDDFDREMIYDNISAIIPFNMRGPKEIATWGQALEAAIRISNDLS